MAERHQDFTRGVYEGIGAYVEMREGQVVIVAPIDGSPAQEAGLQAGDVIVSVNGEEVTGKPLDQVVEEITGPAGTEVTLTIRRPETGETRTLTLERASVNVDRVQWTQLPDSDVAYIRISAFSQGVTQELEEALNGIDEADIDGYILDLRNNPGGLLSEAVGVTSRFLAEGTVVLRRQADDEVISVPVEEEVPKWTETEMVILINEGTASAAEIVTGALQDAGRATVVGQTTFGAGTVLNQFELSDDSVILLAVEEWLTPAEREIWRKGLAPDVAVALPEGVAPLISFRGEDPTAEALQESGDTQLLRALDILEGESA
jgi:carboxyl-terminal processing protease